MAMHAADHSHAVDQQDARRGEGGSARHAQGQQHPLGMYFKVWGLLFVLSAASYMVDYLNFQGLLRWTMIIVFMLMKAGLIVSVFMHLLWERLALVYAILVPPVLLITLLGIGALEADYTFFTRGVFFVPAIEQPAQSVPHK
jgi:cytochrome c oxidase subunit 4